MSIGKKVVGSFVAATLLWAGATAYISSNTEDYLNNYINKSNKIYSSNGMKMSLESFEKGFLTSNAKLSLDFTDPAMKEELKEILKLPMVLEYNIENGPLLFKNGLAIGASRINNKINITKLLAQEEDLKEVIKEDIIFDTNMRVDFSNHIIYKGESNPIVAKVDEEQFTISPIIMNGEMDAETFVGAFKLMVQDIKGDIQGGGKIHLSNLILNGDITKFFENGFYLGDFDFTINNINIQDPTTPVELKKATLSIGMEMDQNIDETINMNFRANLKAGDTKLPKEFNFAKELSFKYGIDATKLATWIEFQELVKSMQNKQQALFKKLSEARDEETRMKAIEEIMTLQAKTEDQMLTLFPKFLVKDKTTLKLQATLLDQRDLTSSAEFNLTYIGEENLPKNREELQEKFQKELLNWVKLNLKVDLQKSLVDKLPQETQQQLAIAMMTGMLKDNNTTFSFDANYVPKKLTVNGEDKSDMLMLFELGMQQGAMQ